MRPLSSLFLLALVIAPALLVKHATAQVAAQPTPPPGTGKKLPLKAVLVLSPEFCATKIKQLCCGAQEIGKSLCTELPPALSGDFASLAVATATSQVGDQTDVVLLPRIATVIGGGGGFTPAAVTIQLEWRVQDKAGRIVWVQTVPGAASTGHRVYNGKKLMRPLTQQAIQAMAALTASLMAGAPELRGFTQRSDLVSASQPASAAEPKPATPATGASNAPQRPSSTRHPTIQITTRSNSSALTRSGNTISARQVMTIFPNIFVFK
jgi:hypothetical protein